MKIKLSSPFRFVAACARAGYAKLFGYVVIAPIEQWDARLEECMNCEELIEETNQCAICTCNVDSKVLLALEQCPKKKWLRVWKKAHY